MARSLSPLQISQLKRSWSALAQDPSRLASDLVIRYIIIIRTILKYYNVIRCLIMILRYVLYYRYHRFILGPFAIRYVEKCVFCARAYVPIVKRGFLKSHVWKIIVHYYCVFRFRGFYCGLSSNFVPIFFFFSNAFFPFFVVLYFTTCSARIGAKSLSITKKSK